mmetsp:Transcript_67114/g.216488  ORF Transcript_67114/g.216488 Transcript_67114/m.216488 type:complete len:218 (+) Transcript_67114:1342-1995(+)
MCPRITWPMEMVRMASMHVKLSCPIGLPRRKARPFRSSDQWCRKPQSAPLRGATGTSLARGSTASTPGPKSPSCWPSSAAKTRRSLASWYPSRAVPAATNSNNAMQTPAMAQNPALALIRLGYSTGMPPQPSRSSTCLLTPRAAASGLAKPHCTLRFSFCWSAPWTCRRVLRRSDSGHFLGRQLPKAKVVPSMPLPRLPDRIQYCALGISAHLPGSP